jgi:hypothetical protein
MRGQRIAKHNSRGGNMSVIATPEASLETARPKEASGPRPCVAVERSENPRR